MDDTVSAFGVIVNVDGYTPDALVAHVGRIEALGFESVWITDLFGRDVYVTAGYLLANTRRIKIGSGIAPIYGRDATASAQAARTLDELYGGRFLHGLGLSHAAMAEARGHTWEDPIAKATAYVAEVREGRLLRPPLAGREVPVHLAAHGPKMLSGPARAADAVLTYMQTPRACAEFARHGRPERDSRSDDAVLPDDRRGDRTAHGPQRAAHLSRPAGVPTPVAPGGVHARRLGRRRQRRAHRHLHELG